jgi:hypothetical protein
MYQRLSAAGPNVTGGRLWRVALTVNSPPSGIRLGPAMPGPLRHASALLTSAASAKRLQSSMELGTAIIDVDFSLIPKIRMSFVNKKSDKKELVERDIEDLDVACGAFN